MLLIRRVRNTRVLLLVLAVCWCLAAHVRAGASASAPAAAAARGRMAFLWRRKKIVNKPTNLIVFQIPGNEQTKLMEPVLRRVERGLNVTIARVNVLKKKAYMRLYMRLDSGVDRCNGLPFFFNRHTGQKICGMTNEYNLILWATDQACIMYDSPADDYLERLEQEQEQKQKQPPRWNFFRRKQDKPVEEEEEAAAEEDA